MKCEEMGSQVLSSCVNPANQYTFFYFSIVHAWIRGEISFGYFTDGGGPPPLPNFRFFLVPISSVVCFRFLYESPIWSLCYLLETLVSFEFKYIPNHSRTAKSI